MKKLNSFSVLLMTLFMGLILSAIVGGVSTLAANAPKYFVLVTGLLFAASIVLPASKKGILLVTFTEGLCEKIQSSLIDILGSAKAPSLKRTQVGYLSALQSAANLAGVSKVPIDPGNGKKRQVRIKYLQRAAPGEGSETPITDCSTEVEREPFEETVTCDRYWRSPGLKFDRKNMRLLCESDASYMAGVINAELNAFAIGLNQKLIALQNINFGKFNPNRTPNFMPVTLLEGSMHRPVYYGESEIIQAFENIDAVGKPMIIGNGIFNHYARQIGIGCCNQEGQNLAQAGNLDFFRDRAVDSVIGTNHLIGLEPGMVQLMTWNENVGDYFAENDVYSHGTIVDPFTGLKLDMNVHYNDCNKTFAMHFGFYYDMFFIPADSFKAADELYGTNGSLHFLAMDDSAGIY